MLGKKLLVLLMALIELCSMKKTFDIKNIVRLYDTELLVPSEINPRKMKSASDFTRLCNSIEDDPQFLVLRPILASKNTKTGIISIYAGEQRWRAARQLGYSEVPAIVEDDVPSDVKEQRMLKDNIHAGVWDEEMLRNNFKLELLDKLNIVVGTVDEFAEQLKKYDDPSRAKYPLIPKFGEKYDYVIIMATHEIDVVWLLETMKTKKVRSYKSTKVGVGHLVTTDDLKALISEWKGGKNG